MSCGNTDFESFIHGCLLFTTGPVQTWLYSEDCRQLISLWGRDEGSHLQNISCFQGTDSDVCPGSALWDPRCLHSRCFYWNTHTHRHSKTNTLGSPSKPPNASSLIQVNNTPKCTTHTHQLPTGWSSVLNKSLKIEQWFFYISGFTVNRSYLETTEFHVCVCLSLCSRAIKHEVYIPSCYVHGYIRRYVCMHVLDIYSMQVTGSCDF